MNNLLSNLLPLLDPHSSDGPVDTALDIPCFQCGVCCVKWQPLLSPTEVRDLATALGMRTSVFSRRYTRAYPLRRGWRQLKATASGCVFLRFDERRSYCSIYNDRPQVCRDWQANLGKRECVTGLGAMVGDGITATEALYVNPADAAALSEIAQSLKSKSASF